ncbi:hypothetical protein McanMca71_001599 [Microsporum canis]|uniref:Uncharacterized protein n=1 Tax=Arthroderma otae (strain ATCC MYA-4605 / CBS 113480) TaxID=554155 RepID=C5FEY9_ARTOC|nr:uncharacterized protein MCYG_01171 [Microsporum canis CBS 113480]EEQ28283.1 predicted protein [Microsporum canis CBS 113480]
MVSIFCPWRRRQKKVSPRDSSSDQSARSRSLPPAFEPITYTPLDPAGEEQQMLDAIFSSAGISASNEDTRGRRPLELDGAISRMHSKSGRIRLGSIGGRLHKRFARDGRLPTPDPPPEERVSMCDSGIASLENKALPDILDSGNSSDVAYDSDAHKLLTPQITARLKSASPANRTILETFCSTPVRNNIPSPPMEQFRLGLDGTPAGERGSQSTEVDVPQQAANADDPCQRPSPAEHPDSRENMSVQPIDRGSDLMTPQKTHLTKAACSNVDDDFRKTPTLTPSDLGASGKPDKEISPLSLADSPESVQIHVTAPATGTPQDVSQSASPHPDVTQIRRNVGTSVYSSPASDPPEFESNFEPCPVVETPGCQVKRSLTSSRVSPENVRKQRGPAASRPRAPSIATQRDSNSIFRRSRFIEDLDDVFTLKFETHEHQKENVPEKRNKGRRCSDGWLSGGKRVGYGYNFPQRERYPRLSCSEGSADERYRSVARLQSIRNGARLDYRLPIQDFKRITRPLDGPGPGKTSTESGYVTSQAAPSYQSDMDRTDQPSKVTSAFASLAKKVRKHRRDESDYTATSSHSDPSHGLEPFPQRYPEADLELPVGFDPARRDMGSSAYNRNPATVKLVKALQRSSSLAAEHSNQCQMVYDEITGGYSDEDDDNVLPEPMTAEVWSRLYDDCLETTD